MSSLPGQPGSASTVGFARALDSTKHIASNFSALGFAVVRDALAQERLAELLSLTQDQSGTKPGTRCLLEQGWCQELAAQTRDSESFRDFIPQHFRAIQCTFFEKAATNNWLVPVHQDLSVPVAARLPLPGWGPWTRKEGTAFVQPPVSVLEELIAVRLHLDPCAANDGPLVVVPQTHRQGIVGSQLAVSLRVNEQVCTAQAGDALIFKPLLLHRSSKATGTSRRRVLHLLFAPPSPGSGLKWRSAA